MITGTAIAMTRMAIPMTIISSISVKPDRIRRSGVAEVADVIVRSEDPILARGDQNIRVLLTRLTGDCRVGEIILGAGQTHIVWIDGGRKEVRHRRDAVRGQLTHVVLSIPCGSGWSAT